MSGELRGRVALVAGATGPIGRATCRALAADGARVAVHFHQRGDVAERIVAELPGDGHLAVGADLVDPEALDRAVVRIERSAGAPTIVVNAAHPSSRTVQAVGDGDGVDLALQLRAVEAHGALCRRTVPAMRAAGWGRLVYVAGALMARPAPGFAAYAAAKAAATVLTRYVALEEGRSGITANVVAPGRVVDPDQPDELDEEHRQLAGRLLERMALPAFPTPAEVADVVVGLVSSRGSALTGQTLWVAGGEPIAG